MSVSKNESDEDNHRLYSHYRAFVRLHGISTPQHTILNHQAAAANRRQSRRAVRELHQPLGYMGRSLPETTEAEPPSSRDAQRLNAKDDDDITRMNNTMNNKSARTVGGQRDTCQNPFGKNVPAWLSSILLSSAHHPTQSTSDGHWRLHGDGVWVRSMDGMDMEWIWNGYRIWDDDLAWLLACSLPSLGGDGDAGGWLVGWLVLLCR